MPFATSPTLSIPHFPCVMTCVNSLHKVLRVVGPQSTTLHSISNIALHLALSLFLLVCACLLVLPVHLHFAVSFLLSCLSPLLRKANQPTRPYHTLEHLCKFLTFSCIVLHFVMLAPVCRVPARRVVYTLSLFSAQTPFGSFAGL